MNYQPHVYAPHLLGIHESSCAHPVLRATPNIPMPHPRFAYCVYVLLPAAHRAQWLRSWNWIQDLSLSPCFKTVVLKL